MSLFDEMALRWLCKLCGYLERTRRSYIYRRVVEMLRRQEKNHGVQCQAAEWACKYLAINQIRIMCKFVLSSAVRSPVALSSAD